MLIGLQLWSVYEEMERDFFGTLGKVAKMGYDGVEFAGYFGHSASAIKDKLVELGLRVAASHIPIESLRDDLNQVIAFEKELGNHDIVCPYAAYETVEEWREFAYELGQINQKIEAAGLTFIYHNHDKEFMKLDDRYVLDLILQHVSKAEIDVYWAAYVGVEPVAYLQQYQARTPLVHIKDMARSRLESTEVGNGILDIGGIVNQAKCNGAEWLIVEQEAFIKPPLESVEVCLKNLKEVLNEC
jgi:sugar phosphate isomerase/epimerase